MSEYQHYQFLVEAPLTDSQLAEIRALTTRARLTRHSFLNTYSWGDFRGDPQALMETHYDAHLYFANWGTRQVILRWPTTVLPLGATGPYCVGDSATVRESGGHVLITLQSDSEDAVEDFIDLFDPEDDEDRDQQWLPSIARSRQQVAEGDTRLLYLAWLLCLQNGELDGDGLEPPVPPGLADLPEALADLATFLRIDMDLIAAAAKRSPQPEPRPSLAAYRAWIATLDAGEKDTVLAHLLHDGDTHMLSELRRRFLDAQPAPDRATAPRTTSEILAAATALTASRVAEEERQEAQARERAAREERQARDRRLADLRHDPEAAWQRASELLAARGTRHYAEVVRIMGDLAALADQEATTSTFTERYARFIAMHRTKKALLRDLRARGPVCADLTALAPPTR
ncbi:hypothetical protein [Streptomyces sp. NPDC054887]